MVHAKRPPTRKEQGSTSVCLQLECLFRKDVPGEGRSTDLIYANRKLKDSLLEARIVVLPELPKCNPRPRV